MSEAIGDSVTVDEFAHLPAGLYYLETGHFDVYNLSPPLLRELAALPVLAARPAGDFARFTTFPEHWALVPRSPRARRAGARGAPVASAHP